METGYRGTFVIAWSQVEIDGFEAAELSALRVGATWRWKGEALCVDGPTDVLRLSGADGDDEMRRRAARKVSRMVGAALPTASAVANFSHEDNCFVVTDGLRSYTVTLIPAHPGSRPLLLFTGSVPPRNTDLWLIDLSFEAPAAGTEDDPGVICFTPGTMIDTPDGTRPVETLREGDTVLTRDDGPQEVLWTGARRMSGARLHAMPELRPVRIFAHAFGPDRPDTSLLVSPQHRLLLRGAEINSLFNTPEVLVRACDLAGTRFAQTDVKLREVTYVHLLLPRHEIITANGIDTESFHPASAALSTLADGDRDRLVSGMPDVAVNPMAYGPYARRNLGTSESALLRHRAA